MSNKRKITYKCPYCDKRFDKENLVIHVGNNHDEMIPENYSAFRFVFDYVNKKPAGYNGKCIICGKETGWDETKGKYNRLCNNPACKKKYIQSFEERMMKSKGVTRISSTAEGQAKMLANRKISGEYKFQDGGIKTYTGTYEKKALEFMDKVMNIQSIDVTTPGPIMEYDFDGKKHIYISDIYYAPYNLIIEVKDGGNNPNMRSMPEYRAKQIAKEKYIIKNTDYNYLRLTNNDFSQLLAVFMQLKMEMSNDTLERVIRINESRSIPESYIKESKEYSSNDVYFTDDISPESVIKLYTEYCKDHNINIDGNIAVKLHSGEPGNQNFIKPEFWGGLINMVDGTVVECNTAYNSKRNTTEGHKKVMIDHGWNQFKYDIMDSDGEIELPVENGKILDTNIVGKNLDNYDSLIVLSHFKGHTMGGYGGALKNIAIGIASRNGKKKIHRVPKDKLVGDKSVKFEQNDFIDAMADAAGTIVNKFKGKIIFINVMKNLSVDCDCDGNAHKPCMKDIGILISQDPVALDTACIDKIYNSVDPGKKQMIERIESRNGLRILDTAQEEGYGKKNYILLKNYIDNFKIKEDTNMTEAMNALMTGYIPGSVDNPNNVYIVNYMQNNVFSDEDPNEDCIGVSDNIKLTNLIVRDNTGMLKRVDESFLKDKDYKVYILEMSKDEVNEKLGKYLGEFVNKNFIYESLTGHKLYTKDQIQFESAFIPTLDYYKYMETFKEICDNYFSAKDKKEIPVNESTFIPKEVRYFNKSGLMYSEKIHNLDEYINSKPNKVLECLDITINN